jgi:hypothetical protein
VLTIRELTSEDVDVGHNYSIVADNDLQQCAHTMSWK